jgi:hypothetical protein
MSRNKLKEALAVMDWDYQMSDDKTAFNHFSGVFEKICALIQNKNDYLDVFLEIQKKASNPTLLKTLLKNKTNSQFHV